MHAEYHDITSRIKESPTWYDSNGVPRYGNFTYYGCPDIYSRFVVLARASCQDCQEEFKVEIHSKFGPRNGQPPPAYIYGDGCPPRHGCTGDTIGCAVLEILEAWVKLSPIDEWERRPELEGDIEQWP